MVTINKQVRLTLFLIAFLLTGFVSAEESDTNNTIENTNASTPQIFLELVDSNNRTLVWKNLRVQYNIVNGSEHYNINRVDLSLPSSLILEKFDGNESNCGTIDVLELRQPYERYNAIPCTINKLHIKEMSMDDILSVITYRPTREVFVATMEYELGNNEGVALTKNVELEVDVGAHPIGMYVGAIIGALLIAILGVMMSLYKYRTNPSVYASPPAFKFLIKEFFFSFLLGWVATTIAILVLQTTSDINFPITVKVQDFYGGVLLGLFGEKVALSIYERIKSPQFNDESTTTGNKQDEGL